MGWVDDVRIWDTAISEGFVAELMAGNVDPDDPNLMVWYDFEGAGSGADVGIPDVSGGLYDGWTVGSATTPSLEPCP